MSEIGCKVPVLLYTNVEFSPNFLMSQQKKYDMLYSTSSYESVKRFCLMEMPFQ